MKLAGSFGDEATRAGTRWCLPDRYNIGVDVCDRWAMRSPDRPAIIEVDDAGRRRVTSFADLRRRSNRCANALRRRGIARCDRVAVLLPQTIETVVAHVAAYKLGAIVVPLASMFGPDALVHRLTDSGCRAVVTHAAGVAKLREIAAALPDLATVLSIDGADAGVLGFHEALAREAEAFAAVATGPDDPALMIYTSGTTGQPKGALHGHRVLLGHLPGVDLSHDGLSQPGDLMWTPADWAWAGGLLNALLPSLHFGIPVVARRVERFEPEAAFAFMVEQGIRNAFIPPTALRLLRGVARPPARTRLALRSVTSAGEPLGAETFAWGRQALGLSINEVYGQTECNYVLASAAAAGVSRPGSIGRAVPGHRVAVIRPDGSLCDPDEVGEIAVRRPDPAMFLGYWNQPDATARKFNRDWMTTGDLARSDADGYVHFVGRDDDIITSSGYRIGPSEIEDCLLRHPAVAAAAAVGKPDALRTEIVKAFVVLRPGHPRAPGLGDEIRGFVRERLSAHEYPREISFVDDLPMTVSGKVLRRVLRERP